MFEHYERRLYIDSDEIIWEHDFYNDEMHPLNYRGNRIQPESQNPPTLSQVEEECKGNIRPCTEIEVLYKYCMVLEGMPLQNSNSGE